MLNVVLTSMFANMVLSSCADKTEVCCSR